MFLKPQNNYKKEKKEKLEDKKIVFVFWTFVLMAVTDNDKVQPQMESAYSNSKTTWSQSLSNRRDKIERR